MWRTSATSGILAHGRGRRYFDPSRGIARRDRETLPGEPEMHRMLIVVMVFACVGLVCQWRAAPADPPSAPRIPAASNEEAWKRLPRQNPPLPIWARVLA